MKRMCGSLRKCDRFEESNRKSQMTKKRGFCYKQAHVTNRWIWRKQSQSRDSLQISGRSISYRPLNTQTCFSTFWFHRISLPFDPLLSPGKPSLLGFLVSWPLALHMMLESIPSFILPFTSDWSVWDVCSSFNGRLQCAVRHYNEINRNINLSSLVCKLCCF